MEREELSHLEPDLSGSDTPKLVFKPSPRLQPISRHQKGLPQMVVQEMFRRSVYLPVHSDVDSTHQTVRVSTLEKPINSSSMESMSNKVEKTHRKGTDYMKLLPYPKHSIVFNFLLVN